MIYRQEQTDTQVQSTTNLENNGEYDRNPSPIKLHPIVTDPGSDVFSNVCDFTKGKETEPESTPGSSIQHNTPVYKELDPMYRQEAGLPSNVTPHAGMILLPDGNVAIASPATARRHRLLQKQPSSKKQNDKVFVQQHQHIQTDFQSPQNSIRMSRENSLLDLVDGGSQEDRSEEEEEDRLAALRMKKRSIEKRVQLNGDFFVPRELDDDVDVESEQFELRSPAVSIEDMERQHFWKQLAFAGAIVLVATGLILFAISFFWNGIAFT
jgi:hypothetical protein